MLLTIWKNTHHLFYRVSMFEQVGGYDPSRLGEEEQLGDGGVGELGAVAVVL